MARLQADRESLIERYTGEINELKAALSSRESAEAQLAEMKASEKRHGLNMDYLKTIVVRFMMESQEKEELVPVLARLLEFSPEELRKVKEARSKRNMSWTALVFGHSADNTGGRGAFLFSASGMCRLLSTT